MAKRISKKVGGGPFQRDGHPMPVVHQVRYAVLTALREGKDPLPDIQGRMEAKRDVIRAILSGAHPYLVSEEGTGKTRLARSLAKLLPPVPAVKGCPYHDDPWWPAAMLCPTCRISPNPAEEFGVEFIPGSRRFSRIQGNEYTNEAKLLGLKDIQAIAQGKSPSDPSVFTGTGFFRANRGILFVDELPAIPTKVQVLLHPVLEEKRVVLEEYNWQHPLDLILIATGNPQGFSHVNEVPRPLLDRLEMIYFDLPNEPEEREIALREKFKMEKSYPSMEAEALYPQGFSPEQIERRVGLPWWIVDLLNKAVRQSRVCRWLERGASIRGTTRAMDHTYATVELHCRNIACLDDATEGLKLALRGRVGLRADLVDFDRPKESFSKTDEVMEDLMWNAFEDLGRELPNWNREKLALEINSILSRDGNDLSSQLREAPELSQAMEGLRRLGLERTEAELLNDSEKKMLREPQALPPALLQEYYFSAWQTVVNLAVHRGIVSEAVGQKMSVPQLVSWARKR